MKKLAVKNWQKHQHYKSRLPPWIKLHLDLLDNPDFELLTGEEVKTLVKIWLLASKGKTIDGELPNLDKLCFVLRIPKEVVEQHLETLIERGWLVICQQTDSEELA